MLFLGDTRRSQRRVYAGLLIFSLLSLESASALPQLSRDGELIAEGDDEIQKQGFEAVNENGVRSYRLTSENIPVGNYQVVDERGSDPLTPLASIAVAQVTGTASCGRSAEDLAIAPSSEVLDALGLPAEQSVAQAEESSAEVSSAEAVAEVAEVQGSSLTSSSREGKKFTTSISIPPNSVFPFDPRTTPLNPACGCRSGNELIQPSTCVVKRSCTAKVDRAPELDPNFQIERRTCSWNPDPMDSTKGVCKTEVKTEYDPSFYQQMVIRCNRLSSPVIYSNQGDAYSEGRCEANTFVSPKLWVLKKDACGKFQTAENCQGANSVNPDALVSGTSEARLYKDAFELKKLGDIQCVSAGNQSLPGFSFPSFEKSCSNPPEAITEGGWKYSCQKEPNRCEVIKSLPRIGSCGIYYAPVTSPSGTKTPPKEPQRIGFMCACQPIQSPGATQIRKGICELSSMATVPGK